MDKMISMFSLKSNELCGDLPAEVQALSSSVTWGWYVLSGNSIGTDCPGRPTVEPTLSVVPSPEPSASPAPTATYSPSGMPTSAPTVNALNDYEALSALYASIGDTMGNSFWGYYYYSNTKRNNWLQGDPCTNSWYGVSCRNGTVSYLYISGRGATGTLPSELSLIHI